MSEIVTHPIDWSSDDHSLKRLDVAHYNLAGQAVDWLSEAEIRGRGIPVDLALKDAANRDAYAPWMGGLETTEAREGFFWSLIAADLREMELAASSSTYHDEPPRDVDGDAS